jgi:hypothetical protein
MEEEIVEVLSSISDDDELANVDLSNPREIADYYMKKNNLVDPDELEVEKKEAEIKSDITQIIDDKKALIEYLANIHASIEVMEERIYELELKEEKREAQRLTNPGSPNRGISSIPFSIL